MLRKILHWCALGLYAACSVALIGALALGVSQSHSIFIACLIVIGVLGFLTGFIELYLLRRNHHHSFGATNSESVHVYVFIDEQDVDTARISLLSCKYLQGVNATTVVCTRDRFDIQSLCDEFGYSYTCTDLVFDDECDQYLFTNGHTILYPDAVLVGQRRCDESISFVELNHNIYSSHALGNNNVIDDVSRATLISTAAGSHSILAYTGGPILTKRSACAMHTSPDSSEVAPSFADVVALVLSTRLQGTITSHPCCECMSHNEIDHNISSRIEKLKVSRRLHRSRANAIPRSIRQRITTFYMRYFWLRSIAIAVVAMVALALVALSISPSIISSTVVSLFLLTQFFSLLCGYLQGDRRRPVERLRNNVLDCEALIHVVTLRVRRRAYSHRYRIRFVPLYLCAMLGVLSVRIIAATERHRFGSTSFTRQALALSVGSIVVIALYRAMYRYLSARQRSFARRSVSITGSSSYESMWIVDLTHRGAAYLSDSRLDIGDETPLVFRVPTMSGDSLITVVGRVTYCGPRGSRYQVGVAFKELSQEALDDLTLYCSIMYPYHQARHIETTENVDDNGAMKVSASRDPRRDRLSIFTYGFVMCLVLGLLVSTLPVGTAHEKISAPVRSSGSASAVQTTKYSFDSLVKTESGQKNVGVITLHVYKDVDNDGTDNAEPGIEGIGVGLYDSNGAQILVGPDGQLGTSDDGTDLVHTNSDGEFSFQSIPAGNYFVGLTSIPLGIQLSDSVVKEKKLVSTVDGFRTSIFSINSKHENVTALNLGFVDEYNLDVKQDVEGVPDSGFVPGSKINVSVNVHNSGPSVAQAGFSVRDVLGTDFDPNTINMVNTAGFTPCGFSGLNLECVATSALASGDTRTIEFSVTSNVSPTSSSDRRMMSASVTPSGLDHAEVDSAQGRTSNNYDENVLPVGNGTSIGDRVFFDANGNGIADSGEQGVAGVHVSLLQFTDTNGDGVMDPGETPEIAHDVSDHNGYFGASSGTSSFENLTPGAQYALTFSNLPKGFIPTIKNTGNDSTVDSDVDPTSLTSTWTTLGAGTLNTSVDLGIVAKPHDLSTNIFVDSNHNLRRDASEKAFVPQDVRLVEWTDTNMNARIDSGEVRNVPSAIVQPSADGRITFPGIRDDISPTYYAVDFDVPNGYSLEGSTSNQKVGHVRSPFLSESQFNNSHIALLEKGVSVKGSLWIDFNRNATKDASEYGPLGIRVRLISTAGKSVTATTDSNGNYDFPDVAPGKYSLGVERSSLPKGFTLPSFEDNSIANNLSGRTDIFVNVNNTPVDLRDLALTSENSGQVESVRESARANVQPSFVSDLANGNFAHASITPHQEHKTRSVTLGIVFLCGLLIVTTLAKRRKLLYRNH